MRHTTTIQPKVKLLLGVLYLVKKIGNRNNLKGNKHTSVIPKSVSRLADQLWYMVNVMFACRAQVLTTGMGRTRIRPCPSRLQNRGIRRASSLINERRSKDPQPPGADL